MKIKKLFHIAIIIFFLIIHLEVFAQLGNAKYLIQYKVSFVIDSTNPENRTIETHNLYTGLETSYYASIGTIYMDSLTEVIKNKAALGNINLRWGNKLKSAPKSAFSAQVYKDLNDKTTWVEEQLSTNRYLYEVPNLPLNWVLSNEHKTIQNFTVHKATVPYGGRNWVAWYTTEIPIPDGPYIFSDLPGLILEIYDEKNDYHFQVISVKKLNKNYVVKLPKAGIQKVTKIEFKKAFKNYKSNPVFALKTKLEPLINSGIKVPDPTTGEYITISELIKKVKRAANSRNNYIELF